MPSFSTHTIIHLLAITATSQAYKCAPSIPSEECVLRAQAFSAGQAKPAYSCAPSVPAASCLSMASAFSASRAHNSPSSGQQQQQDTLHTAVTTFQTIAAMAPAPTKPPSQEEIFMRTVKRQQRDFLAPKYECDMKKVTPEECRRQAVSFSSRVQADMANMQRQGGGGNGNRNGQSNGGSRPPSNNGGNRPPPSNNGGNRGGSSGGNRGGGGKGRLVDIARRWTRL